MQELAELVIQIVGGKSKLSFHPLPVDDPKQRQPDISLARQELDWEPKVALREGLQQTVNYFKKIV
jgi:UDP-glucuronate decarboxylase